MKMVFVSRNKVWEFDNEKDVPFVKIGVVENYEELRKQGACVHRAELDDQPVYTGWLGPMWDGGKLRYETQEVYDMLSH